MSQIQLSPRRTPRRKENQSACQYDFVAQWLFYDRVDEPDSSIYVFGDAV